MSKLLQDVVGELSKLPGVGRRTALRLAIHILRMERDSVAEMTASIDRFRNEVKYCSQCNNLSDEDICPICADRERDHATICVVEQVADVLSVENTRQYRGMYHVLGGVISPMQGISPSDLKIDLLCERSPAAGEGRARVEGETTLAIRLRQSRRRRRFSTWNMRTACGREFPGLKVTSDRARYRFRRRTGVCRRTDDHPRADEPPGDRVAGPLGRRVLGAEFVVSIK